MAELSPEEARNIQARLQEALLALEQHTALLKKDLALLDSFLQAGTLSPDAENSVKDQLSKTEQQLQANQQLITSLQVEDTAPAAATEATVTEATVVDLLAQREKETVQMLERMQHKVLARQELADLYQAGQAASTQAPQTDPPPPPPKKTLQQEAQEIRNTQQLEDTVAKFKQQDALEALKKKLKEGGNAGS
jgi:hypothetical protein